MLRGHAIKDLGIISRRLGTDPMHGQTGLAEGVAQGIAVGAGRFQGDDQAPAPADLLEQVRERGQVSGIAAAPGAIEITPGPAEHAEDVILADIEPAVNELLAPSLEQQGEGNLVDINSAVCFPLHGDDLP
jgi:hypothetical protein